MRSGFGWRHICPVLQQGTGQTGASREGKHRKAFPCSESLPAPAAPGPLLRHDTLALGSSVLVLTPNFATFRASWGLLLLPPVIMEELAGQQ